MPRYGMLFAGTGVLGLGGVTAGLGYYLANSLKQTCNNTVETLTGFLTSQNNITLKNIATDLDGYPVVLDQTILFPREQLSEYFINFLENLPKNTAFLCERGSWTLVSFGAILILLGSSVAVSLYQNHLTNQRLDNERIPLTSKYASTVELR